MVLGYFESNSIFENFYTKIDLKMLKVTFYRQLEELYPTMPKNIGKFCPNFDFSGL